MEDGRIRLNKYLSEAGLCSRRTADAWIQQGRILVDGLEAFVGMKVCPGQKISLDGKEVGEGSAGSHKQPPILLAVNKPRGIVCTTSHKDRAPNIVDMVGFPGRIYPIGRLDKDSEGLILMTNQGDLVNRISKSANAHEKEYLVTVNQEVTGEFLRRMASGVPVLNQVTRPCFVEKTGTRAFRIILTQGLNRQIRRMCHYLGCQVETLKRVRIMNIGLGDLEIGAWRPVEGQEYKILQAALEDSTSLPGIFGLEEHQGGNNP